MRANKNTTGDRPRPILLKFLSMSLRNKVWAAKSNLKGTQFSLNEDFPKEIRDNRKVLLPYFLAARNHPSVKQCALINDKLIIDSKEYDATKIDTLPFNLSSATSHQRYISENSSTAFFGSDSFLSNFHPCVFKHEGIEYSSSEQYFQYKKAIHFNDKITAQRILHTKNPRYIKALSYKIKGFEEREWSSVSKEVMFHGCNMKFGQNENLKTQLKKIPGLLIEANPKDNFWSCGLGISHPDIAVPEKWPGKNMLGDILYDIKNNI